MNRSEDSEQIALFNALRFYEAQYPEVELLFHIPNGGSRNSIVEGARFKRMGVKPGVPDLFLPVPKQGFNGLFVEMKKARKLGKRGKYLKAAPTSSDQALWIKELINQGYQARVCYGADEAIETILNYLRD